MDQPTRLVLALTTIAVAAMALRTPPAATKGDAHADALTMLDAVASFIQFPPSDTDLTPVYTALEELKELLDGYPGNT